MIILVLCERKFTTIFVQQEKGITRGTNSSLLAGPARKEKGGGVSLGATARSVFNLRFACSIASPFTYALSRSFF